MLSIVNTMTMNEESSTRNETLLGLKRSELPIIVMMMTRQEKWD